jgi:hypothetical protein
MDRLGRDYVVLALGVGRLQEGIVDSYYGPPELAEEANATAADAGQLAADAARLRAAAAADPDPRRALWLDRQLIALETLARRLGGEEMDYLDEVESCFGARPTATAPEVYAAAHRALDELLPPGPDLRARVEARGERLTIPKDRLAGIADWLIAQLRADSDAVFASPAGERLEVSLVTDQPWSAYNWYDGNLSSRVEINTDLPVRAAGLIGTLAHETFPGHHLEHTWKEQRLVRELGRAEASVQLINTPEAYISEGLADLGSSLTVDDARWQELFAGVCEQAGIELGPDEPAAQRRVTLALEELGAIGADAALMLHDQRRPRDEVAAFIMDNALRTAEQAEKTLEFISHPLWRTYIFCYSGGEALLKRWCAGAGDLAAQRRRFFRLLTEQLTTVGIVAETAAEMQVAR